MKDMDRNEVYQGLQGSQSKWSRESIGSNRHHVAAAAASKFGLFRRVEITRFVLLPDIVVYHCTDSRLVKNDMLDYRQKSHQFTDIYDIFFDLKFGCIVQNHIMFTIF